MYDKARNWNRKNTDNYIEIYLKSNIIKILYVMGTGLCGTIDWTQSTPIQFKIHEDLWDYIKCF